MSSTGAPPRPGTRPRPATPAGARPRRHTSTALDPRAAVRSSQNLRFRRSITLLALTLVLPGSAQIARGNRRLGQVVLGAWLALWLTAAAVLLTGGAGLVAGIAVSPDRLELLRVGALALAAAWVVALLDAWRLGDPPRLRRGHRLAMTGTALALVGVVTVPLLLASHYAAVQKDLVSTLFPSGEAAAASDGRLNLLLLGADSSEERLGLRTDSMNLVSVDVTTGHTVLVGMPRNFEDARFPAGTPLAAQFPDGFRGEEPASQWLLNGVYHYGTEHPDLVPGAADPGAEAIKQAISGTLGLDVHYYLLVDLGGFKQVVDALGGVTLELEEDVPYGQSGGVLRAGVQDLNGREALWYARSRTGGSDYVRMHRQRCVLGALLHEADPVNVLRRFGALAGSAKSVITTDIPQAALPQFVDLAVSARSQGVDSLQMSPPLVQPGAPDLPVMRAALAAAFDPPETDEAPVEAAPVAQAPSGASGPTVDPSSADALAADPGVDGTAAEPPVGDVRGAGGSSTVDGTCSYG